MANAVVTGGCGFIGANLCASLLSAGQSVICVDNFSTSRRENVAHLEAHPRFRVVSGDVRSALRFDADVIYNLACPASPAKYQSDPVFTTETCVLGAINVLDLARCSGARVLHASTSEIYGEPRVSPQAESYRGDVNSWGPRACYDEGKRCAEALCYDYRSTYGVDVRVVRIFNTYGPRMSPDDGRVVSNFIVQALSGRPLTVFGDGSQTRSLCHVDDLLRGFDAVMRGPDCACPVNLGNPEEMTVLEIAHRVMEAVGGPVAIRHEPLPVDDPTRRCPDISLARDRYGWAPRIPFAEGLRRTVDHFREHLGLDAGFSGRLAEAAE